MDDGKMESAIAVAKALTNGGRALNAIWRCKNIDTNEKMILLYLGSQLDFRGDFTESVERHVSTIVEMTGIKRTTVFDRLKSLESKGYIERKNTHRPNGTLGANEYYLTDLIFIEYQAMLTEKVVRQPDYPSSPAGLPSSGSRTTLVRQPDYPSSPAGYINPSSSLPSSESHPSSGGGRRVKTPPPKDGVEIDLARELDWIFRKNRQGGYSFATANGWMAGMIKQRGEDECRHMVSWFAANAGKYRETCPGSARVSGAGLMDLVEFYDSMSVKQEPLIGVDDLKASLAGIDLAVPGH